MAPCGKNMLSACRFRTDSLALLPPPMASRVPVAANVSLPMRGWVGAGRYWAATRNCPCHETVLPVGGLVFLARTGRNEKGLPWPRLLSTTQELQPPLSGFLLYTLSAALPDCPAGIRAREKSVPPRTRVREVGGDEAGVRVFVVDSEQRREYEQAQREKAMEALREELEGAPPPGSRRSRRER